MRPPAVLLVSIRPPAKNDSVRLRGEHRVAPYPAAGSRTPKESARCADEGPAIAPFAVYHCWGGETVAPIESAATAGRGGVPDGFGIPPSGGTRPYQRRRSAPPRCRNRGGLQGAATPEGTDEPAPTNDSSNEGWRGLAFQLQVNNSAPGENQPSWLVGFCLIDDFGQLPEGEGDRQIQETT